MSVSCELEMLMATIGPEEIFQYLLNAGWHYNEKLQCTSPTDNDGDWTILPGNTSTKVVLDYIRTRTRRGDMFSIMLWYKDTDIWGYFCIAPDNSLSFMPYDRKTLNGRITDVSFYVKCLVPIFTAGKVVLDWWSWNESS